MSPLEGLSLLVGACWSELAGWGVCVCESAGPLLCRTGDGSVDGLEAWLSVREGIRN